MDETRPAARDDAMDETRPARAGARARPRSAAPTTVYSAEAAHGVRALIKADERKMRIHHSRLQSAKPLVSARARAGTQQRANPKRRQAERRQADIARQNRHLVDRMLSILDQPSDYSRGSRRTAGGRRVPPDEPQHPRAARRAAVEAENCDHARSRFARRTARPTSSRRRRGRRRTSRARPGARAAREGVRAPQSPGLGRGGRPEPARAARASRSPSRSRRPRRPRPRSLRRRRRPARAAAGIRQASAGKRPWPARRGRRRRGRRRRGRDGAAGVGVAGVGAAGVDRRRALGRHRALGGRAARAPAARGRRAPGPAATSPTRPAKAVGREPARAAGRGRLPRRGRAARATAVGHGGRGGGRAARAGERSAARVLVPVQEDEGGRRTPRAASTGRSFPTVRQVGQHASTSPSSRARCGGAQAAAGPLRRRHSARLSPHRRGRLGRGQPLRDARVHRR